MGSFGLVCFFVSTTGEGHEDYILVWQCHRGHSYPVVFCGLWLNISTKSEHQNKYCTLSTYTKGQGWISTQIEECDLPLCVCASASHASRGAQMGIWLCQCATWHKNSLWWWNCVFYSSCDGPETVGEFQDCHCSLQTTCIVWELCWIAMVSLSTRYLT